MTFKLKFYHLLLTHKEFLINIHDIISDEYFENSAHKWAIKEVLKYYDKYHTTPSLDILKVELQKVDNEVLQISIKEQLKKHM
jgi:Ni,Fe-hydrogenase maturation factor